MPSQISANTANTKQAVSLQRSPTMPTALDSCNMTVSDRQGPNYDEGCSDGSQLLGAGARLSLSFAAQLLSCLEQFADQLGHGWDMHSSGPRSHRTAARCVQLSKARGGQGARQHQPA